MNKKIIFLFFLPILIIGCNEKITKNNLIEKSTQNNTILINNNHLSKSKLIIKVGDTIEWINNDKKKHSITFEDARIDQVLLYQGRVNYTFKEKGEARYFCKFHPEMKGTILIR